MICSSDDDKAELEDLSLTAQLAWLNVADKLFDMGYVNMASAMRIDIPILASFVDLVKADKAEA